MAIRSQIKSDPKLANASGASAESLLKEFNSRRLQLTVQPGTATAGTIALSYKAKGAANYETLLDKYGAAVTVTLAAGVSKTFSFDILADGIKGTPSGANGTWDFIVHWYE